MTDFFDLVHTQRACREFSSDDVSDDDLATILDAATFAPSAENRQPWEFIVLRDEAARARLGELTQQAWETGAREFSERRLSPQMFADVDRSMTSNVAAAPVAIVVCADVQRGLELTVPSSIFPAVQNLLLAATALGLGSALTTITTGYREELAELLGLPDHVRAVAVIPIGHPARQLGAPRREPFAEHTHRDRFGTSW